MILSKNKKRLLFGLTSIAVTSGIFGGACKDPVRQSSESAIAVSSEEQGVRSESDLGFFEKNIAAIQNPASRNDIKKHFSHVDAAEITARVNAQQYNGILLNKASKQIAIYGIHEDGSAFVRFADNSGMRIEHAGSRNQSVQQFNWQ